MLTIDQDPNICQIVNNDDRLKTLAIALKATGLDEVGQQASSFTVFAPSDAAFAKVPSEIVQSLSDSQNRDELIEVLTYHAIGDRVLTSSELLKMSLPACLGTLSDDFITVTKQGDQLKINDVTIITSDIMASNGIIHIIDAVLMPPSLSK